MLLAAICAATVAFAQPPVGRPGAPFGRGMGFGPGRGGILGLLRSEAVQKELKLSDEQRELIRELADEVRTKIREQFSGFDFRKLRDMSDQERQKLFEEGRRKMELIAKEAEETLELVLEPHQLKRLKQLQLQREGVFAIGRPDIAKQLGLSEQQIAKVRELIESLRPDREKMREVFRQGRDAVRKYFAEREERRKEAEKQILELLTPEQRKKWEGLIGEPFEFPDRDRGRRGGPSRRDRAARRA
jgi:Spy/CpxP family protein refolding chaperone